MLETTEAPNGTLYFQTTPAPAPGSRNARTAKAISKGDTEAETSFRVGVRIRPTDFRFAQARIPAPGSVDFSSGQIYAGGLRLARGQKVPDWIVNGLDCSLTAAEYNSGQTMTAVFYWVPFRSKEMMDLGIGSEIVLHVKRVN